VFGKPQELQGVCLWLASDAARFVKEGDTLPGEITVLQVNYTERYVTVGKGGETAVIHAKNAMLPAIPPPKVAGMSQQQQRGGFGNQGQGSWPNPPQRTTAMRDGNGRWHVVFPNGNAVDMQSVVERRGSVQAAIEHAQGHLERESSPERTEYFREEIRALRAMREAGQK